MRSPVNVMHTLGKIVLVVLFATIAVLCFRQGTLALSNLSDPGISRDADTRFNMKVGLLMFLSSGAFAAFGALYWMRRIWPSKAAVPELSNQSKRSIKRYLAFASIPGAACVTFTVLVFTETVNLTDDFYPIIIPFGAPALLAMGLTNSELGILQLTVIAIVSFGYCWAIGIPTGQLAGLLPSRASRGLLWMIQLALVTLHLWWGWGVLQMTKA